MLPNISTEGRRLLVVAVLFFCLNCLLIMMTVPGGNLALDSKDYLQMARALLRHGAFVNLDYPDIAADYRQPGYALFLCFTMLVSETGILLTVIMQALLLLLTGWLAYQMTEDLLPGYGFVAMCLVIFNPNACGNVHLILSDTLFTFIFMISVWSFFRYFKKAHLRYAATAGGALALSCLVRPEPLYLIYMLPVLFPICGLAGSSQGTWLRWTGAGCIALVAAITVLLPWMLRNYQVHNEFRVSSSTLASAFIWDSVMFLERIDHPEKTDRAINQVMGIELQKFRKKLIKKYKTTDAKSFDSEVIMYAVGRALNYEPLTIVKAFGQGAIGFFASGGAKNFLQVLGIDNNRSDAIFDLASKPKQVVALWIKTAVNSPAAMVVTFLSYTFVILLRIFGLFGAMTIIARRNWLLAISLFGLISYFWLIHLFNGQSRYRLPIEPLLIFLALYGLNAIRDRYTDLFKSAK